MCAEGTRLGPTCTKLGGSTQPLFMPAVTLLARTEVSTESNTGQLLHASRISNILAACGKARELVAG